LVEAIDSTRNTDVAKRQESDIESESFRALIIQHLHKTVHDTNLVELLLPEAFQFLKLDFDDIYDRKVIERNKAVLTLLNQPDGDPLRAGVHGIDISFSDPLNDLCRTEI